MRRYLDEQRVSCKPSTVGTYIGALRDFHSFLRRAFRSDAIASKHFASIDRKTLDLYLAHLHGQRLAPYSTVNKFLAVRKYLAWEVEHGAIDQIALEGFDRSRLPKTPDYLPRPLSKETDRILAERMRNSNDPHAKAFLLLRLTGLRISELINLAPACTITTARNETFLKVPLGKMDNERLVPLSSEAMRIIQDLRESQNLRCGPRDPGRLIGAKGDVRNVYNRLALRFKRFTADIQDQGKPVTFHRLRHTYATSLLAGGVGIASIMKLLGHRRIEMSLRYAGVTPSHLRDEYLRAISAIERQCLPPHLQNPPQLPLPTSPLALVDQLAALLNKIAPNDAPKSKNLRRRLARLRSDVQNLQPPPASP